MSVLLWLLPKVWLLRLYNLLHKPSAILYSLSNRYWVNCLLNMYNLCILQSVMNHDDALKNCHLSRINKCLVIPHVPKCFLSVQTYWAGPKIELYLVLLQKNLCYLAQKLDGNHLLVWYKKFRTCTICQSILTLAQKVWTSPKSFGTCRRTRQKSLI